MTAWHTKGSWGRSIAIAGGVCLFLLMVSWFWALKPAPSRISAGTLDKIQPGMARAEVEELLGGPPGDYSRQQMIYDPEDPFVPTGQADDAELSLSPEDQWRGERLMIVVDFDGAGKVKWAVGLRPARSGWYQMLQRWLPFLR